MTQISVDQLSFNNFMNYDFEDIYVPQMTFLSAIHHHMQVNYKTLFARRAQLKCLNAMYNMCL